MNEQKAAGHLRGTLPEIGAEALSVPLLRERMKVARAVVVRGLIKAPEVALLSQGMERAFDAWDKPDSDPEWFHAYPHQYSIAIARGWAREQGGVLAVECPPMLERLRQAIRNAGLEPFIESFLGETPVLSSAKTTLRLNPPETGGIGWHQDGAFLGENARTLNIWLALTPCGIDAPSLDIALSRKDAVVGAGEDDADYAWSVGELRAMRESPMVATPVLEPGDAILFDHLCLHRTAVLKATQTRKAIESWFFAPGSLPPDYDAVPL